MSFIIGVKFHVLLCVLKVVIGSKIAILFHFFFLPRALRPLFVISLGSVCKTVYLFCPRQRESSTTMVTNKEARYNSFVW